MKSKRLFKQGENTHSMIDFYISLGGICFNIHCNYRITKDFFKDYLVKEDEQSIPIIVDEKDLLLEWKKSSAYDGTEDSVKRIWYEPTFEKKSITRKIMGIIPSYNAILMHGLVIHDGDYAYMFTAPSGTGKTTRGRLFIKKHSNCCILNGDKPIIRLEDKKVIACGSPWRGKEGYGLNLESPLKAIYLLERADKTEILPIKYGEAFDFLLQQAFISPEGNNINKTIEILKSIGDNVKIFRFRSPCTVESVEAAYNAAHIT